MIKEFVGKWFHNKNKLEEWLGENHPSDYLELVRRVINILQDENSLLATPDPSRIHQIDDGDYQGTLMFVIGETGYQPSTYWYVKVDYGSCSGCDTLQGIRGYLDGKPTEEQIKDYMTLALHIIQGLKKMEEQQ